MFPTDRETTQQAESSSYYIGPWWTYLYCVVFSVRVPIWNKTTIVSSAKRITFLSLVAFSTRRPYCAGQYPDGRPASSHSWHFDFFKMLTYHHVSTRKSLLTSTHCFLVNGLDGRNILPSRLPYLTTFDLWRIWRSSSESYSPYWVAVALEGGGIG